MYRLVLGVVCLVMVMSPLSLHAESFLHAPHDEAHGIFCVNCHLNPLNGPWPEFPPTVPTSDDTLVNFICLRCHDGSVDAPLEVAAPMVTTHSHFAIRGVDGWTNPCTACHDPHFQEQLDYLASAADRLYLLRGTITTAEFFPQQNAATFSYALTPGVTVAAVWQDPARWAAKAGTGRGLLLVPDLAAPREMYEITAASATSITVQGMPESDIVGREFGLIYGQLIRSRVRTPGQGEKKVEFFDGATLPIAATGGFVDLTSITAPHGICQVCHTATSYYNPTRNGHFADPCTNCHFHGKGFAHGNGSGSGMSGSCPSCHGHDAGFEIAPGQFSVGAGSFVSHSTHTERDADDQRGPLLDCGDCHNITSFPAFAAGVDNNGDGRISLAETTVCDPCHSSGGPYDGVNDPVFGAKNNWRLGVYNGAALKPGKETWCVGCHDAGQSMIPASGGRQAPDVAGDGVSFGYYASGHGAKTTECGGCHDLAASHNFDGKRTYQAVADNYRQGYRLKLINGQNPLRIPADNTGCAYDAGDYRLCFSCHSEQALLSDSQADGVYECATNPYKNAPAITTGFRNVSDQGFNGGLSDVPANIHWDHLADINTIFRHRFWDSDRDGTQDSRASCITCHNPHGAARTSGGATHRMTVPGLDIVSGNDAVGDYGELGPDYRTDVCFVCHFSPGYKYFRQSLPSLAQFSVSDRNPADPGQPYYYFTNERVVKVQITATGEPLQVLLAESSDFLQNSSGWQPYTASLTYTLSVGDGLKQVYCKLRNGRGESTVLSSSITLDTTPPPVTSSTLLAPNGGEVWAVNSTQTISWQQVFDANASSAPIRLELSVNGGSTFPVLIHGAVGYPGTYSWLVPATPTTQAKVRLIYQDKGGNQSSDVSDGVFTIQ